MATQHPDLDVRLLESDSFDSPSHTKSVTPEERAIVNRCLDAVEARGKQLEKKGLTKINFIFGVTNSLFVAWSFGAIPEHFWIVYLVEVFVMFPLRWRNQVRAAPLKQHYYWCDFCWMINFATVGAVIFFAIHGLADTNNDVSLDMRRRVFSAAWGLGCGPLLMAVGVLGNALIFHDADNVASVLIHLFPSMVLYVMGWEGERVHQAWPRIFELSYFDGLRPFQDIYLNAAGAYTVWVVYYTVWLLLHGKSLPAAGYDTIYHYNMRAGFGRLVAKATGTPEEEYKTMVATNCFPIKFIFAYMFGHALAVYVAIGVSLLCILSKYIHCGLCGVMAIATIYNGASRYTFYIIKSYGQVLRHELGIPLNRRGSAL